MDIEKREGPDISAESLFNVKGLVVVVTGGGTGIGLMIAQALEANGAKHVYIVGRRADVLERAARTAKYGNIIPFSGDVTSRSDVAALVSRVETDADRLDILVHGAGVMPISHRDLKIPDDGTVESIQKIMLAEAEKDWMTQFSVNVTAVYFVTAGFLGLLKKSNEFWLDNACRNTDEPDSGTEVTPLRTAQVITVTGISGYFRSMAASMGYASSKAASIHLMKTLSTVLAPTNIRFNCLAPGIFPTEMTEGKGHLDDKNRNHLGPFDRTKIPQERAGDVKDMAGAILYLCGRSGYYCNGSIVVTDGVQYVGALRERENPAISGKEEKKTRITILIRKE